MIKRFVDNTKLLLVDDLPAEDLAMLQALYSRSAESAETHISKIHAGCRDEVAALLAKYVSEADIERDALTDLLLHAAQPVTSARAGSFMGRHYVGYGHKSIADCASTTLFIEGVSMLAAKAIQDWPLYSGQETSTRYVDMTSQPVIDPIGSSESAAVIASWMNFFRSSLPRVNAVVRERHPRRPNEREDIYDRAVAARTFDILRAFLPAGTATQLSWHTNLRQAADHLAILKYHPLEEVANVARSLLLLLQERYPSSFSDQGSAGVSGVATGERQQEREEWIREVAHLHTYNEPAETRRISSTIPNEVGNYQIVRSRPRGCVLPHFLSDLGQITFSFDLDFGSFRDIQRHRNGVCRMPLLTLDRRFESWYVSESGDYLGTLRFIEKQEKAIRQLTSDESVRQYYIPMGYRVPCSITYGLPAAVYVMELRSGKMIHPTLRHVVHGMISNFRARHPEVPIHVDEDLSDWDVRRGAQTITKKEDEK